jgi:hypothetical protein
VPQGGGTAAAGRQKFLVGTVRRVYKRRVKKRGAVIEHSPGDTAAVHWPGIALMEDRPDVYV